jgi:hypothetical protein
VTDGVTKVGEKRHGCLYRTRVNEDRDFADTIDVNMFGNRRRPGVITIAAIAVAIGLLPLPYAYYMLLRVFLCVLCIYFISSVRGVRDGEKWVLVGLAVLFNPIAPVELGSKPLWSIINIGAVVWFWMLDRRATGTFRS